MAERTTARSRQTSMAELPIAPSTRPRETDSTRGRAQTRKAPEQLPVRHALAHAAADDGKWRRVEANRWLHADRATRVRRWIRLLRCCPQRAERHVRPPVLGHTGRANRRALGRRCFRLRAEQLVRVRLDRGGAHEAGKPAEGPASVPFLQGRRAFARADAGSVRELVLRERDIRLGALRIAHARVGRTRDAQPSARARFFAAMVVAGARPGSDARSSTSRR